ncbi:MAG: hypothetical protein K8J09_14805 [Planctomycetes bacterium]|nr:hypothetical protein [Planctomycetota bacterium]MCC7395975.1 isopenicillin N synthase family oxygenase [Planctomycetota bacterium]
MSLPLLDLACTSPAELVSALQQDGALSLCDSTVDPAIGSAALAAASTFFDLPLADKQALAIEGSAHWRGFSTMQNERDHREQLHFGNERPPSPGPEPWRRLIGPNSWPRDASFRAHWLAYLDTVAGVGRRLLTKLARAFDLDSSAWLGADPYLLMKCIGYLPQPLAGPPRSGVAAHLDFSLVTLTQQDDVGGLEVMAPDGTWREVPCRPSSWLVNIGELLAYVVGERLRATPHRVVNRSSSRRRVSMPVFVNPSLDVVLMRAATRSPEPVGPHVHAVLSPPAPPRLPFGEAEWRRKGENVWCARCCGSGSGARDYL